MPLSEPLNIGRGSVTQQCVGVNSGTENTNRCLFPDYCLETNKCQALSHQFVNRIGRADVTQACIPANSATKAVSCALHYCLKDYGLATAKCVSLTNVVGQYGKESNTHQCLDLSQTTTAGIMECATDYCLYLNIIGN